MIIINFKFNILVLILILLAQTFIVCASESNSLWTDEAASLYQDRQSFKVGDIITVLIEEEANANQSANTATSQDSSVGAGPGLGIFDFIKQFSLDYSDSEDAEGATERSGSLAADITVQIENILSNGNFEIKGNKQIKINGEEQVIKLTGVIRPEDVTLENTILSKQVAQAAIEYEGVKGGVITQKQRPGVFTRILNWIF
ncbi:MAG: flagellar basal body L-ring protein FlgH [bacterium]